MAVFGEKKIKSRFLAERSYLYFKYPSMGSDFFDFYLPMLENIEIQESQKPNLVTYDLLGRAGNLFAYTGSKSREFTLKFNITLPNVSDYLNTMGISEKFSWRFKGFKKNRHEEILKFTRTKEQGGTMGFSPYSMASREFNILKEIDVFTLQDSSKRFGNIQNRRVQAMISGGRNSESNLEITDNLTGETFFDEISVNANVDQNGRVYPPTEAIKVNNQEVIDYVIQWINVIRSSVVNNSMQTNLGPPTVYINHGTMYNNIPCVCTSVQIRIVNQFGYDLVSLTPRQVEVNMSLSENRVGNFDEFMPFNYVEGENVAGWESVIIYNTMDPYDERSAYTVNQKEFGSLSTEVADRLLKFK